MTRVSAMEGHRLWAESYDAAPNALVALETRIMRRILRPVRPKRMIDVACGTGRWMLRMQQRGASVFGVDGCNAMLSEAAKHSSLRGKLLLGDAAHLPITNGTADLVLCSLALGYFADLQQSMRELARICAPGGQVAICDLHPEGLAAGWTRSFTREGAKYEIEHHVYQWKQIELAANDAGLCMVVHESAKFGELEQPFFQNAGKQHALAKAAAVPALFVGVWKRPC
ncbi:MAG TPA: class I SAM-dependent methyltransferase [Bryobacteraceae bacterium]|nr:class I SAM-dependent methyltransferase [Bryobacteraceae bacterium]